MAHFGDHDANKRIFGRRKTIAPAYRFRDEHNISETESRSSEGRSFSTHRPSECSAPRSGTFQALPSHVKTTIHLDGNRRNTVVMPLMTYLSRLGGHNRRSLSFRSSDANRTQPVIPMENTYQLGPAEKFPYEKVKATMEVTLSNRLSSRVYEPSSMAHESKILSDLIKDKLKDLTPKRHKLVTWVSIGQQGNAGLTMASRCLWNADHDSFAEATFENTTIYAVAIAFAVYKE